MAAKLTDTHRAIIERNATGRCIHYTWQWSLDGRPVTKQVNTLIARGLIEATYFRNGATTNATDAGRYMIS